MTNKVHLELQRNTVEVVLRNMNEPDFKSSKAVIEHALRKSGEKVKISLSPYETTQLHKAVALAALEQLIDESLGRETALAIESSLQRQTDPKWYVNLPYRVQFWERVLVH